MTCFAYETMFWQWQCYTEDYRVSIKSLYNLKKLLKNEMMRYRWMPQI